MTCTHRPARARPSTWIALAAGIAAGFGLLAGIFATPGCSSAPRASAAAPAAPAMTAEQREAQVRSFDQVWTTVKDKHWDSTMGGVDWDAVRAELRPRAENAVTAGDARAAIRAMLDRLGKSHYAVIPAETYERLAAERAAGGGEGVTGISVRVIDSRALVWRVRPGSPAARAGVSTGWIISSAAGKPVDESIRAVREALGHSSELEFMLTAVVEQRLKGPIGSTIAVEFLDAGDRTVRLDLGLDEPPGERTQIGNLPATRVVFDSRRLPSNVGYFTFSPFLAPSWVMPQVQKFVTENSDCAGMVIDLRGNPGGMIPMTNGIAGFFIAEPDTRLGKMVTRDTTLNLVVNPRTGGFTGPVAVITDGSSVSSSEILAGGLQDIGRARVFGTRTAGACLPSVVEKLPSGDGFQYAFADYISAGGQSLEGRGVTPDEVVPTTREGLLAGRDEPLDAAVRWIMSRAASK